MSSVLSPEGLVKKIKEGIIKFSEDGKSIKLMEMKLPTKNYICCVCGNKINQKTTRVLLDAYLNEEGFGLISYPIDEDCYSKARNIKVIYNKKFTSQSH